MRKRTKWTPERVAHIKVWQEQGTALEDTKAVQDGLATIGGIYAKGNREFGFGIHKREDGKTILKPTVAWHKTKRNKSAESMNAETPDKVVGEPDLSDGSPLWDEVLKDVEELPLEPVVDAGFCGIGVLGDGLMRLVKKRKLNEIITSFETLGQKALADDLRYCTS